MSHLFFQVYKFILAPCAQLYSLAETPQLLPSAGIWTQLRESYWSPKMDDISLAYHEGVDSYGLKDAGGAEQPPL